MTRVPLRSLTVAIGASFLLSSHLPVHAQSPLPAPTALSPPVAEVRPVTNTYFGAPVVDPYQWMEGLKDPQVVSWFKGQADYSRSVLDSIPGRDALLSEIKSLDNASESVGNIQIGGGSYFYMKVEPGFNTGKLFVRDGLKGQERLLVDPDKLAGAGAHFSIDYYAASLDGRYVAYAESPGGSENSVLHVLDVQTGQDLTDIIDRTQYGGVVWRSDNKSFFYIRLQKLAPGADPVERYKKSLVYLHVLGSDPDKDPAIFGYGISTRVQMTEEDDPQVVVTPSSSYAFGIIIHGVRREQTIYSAPLSSLSEPDVPWQKIADVEDGVEGFDVRGDTLYILTHKGASRFKVISTSVSHPDLDHAKVVVPAGEAVIKALSVAQDALYVQTLDGGIGRILRVPFSGDRVQKIPLPYEGNVGALVTYWNRTGTLFLETGWTHSALWYSYDPASNRVTDTELKKLSPISFAGYTSHEVKAEAPDGTLIPLSIICSSKIKLDGSHPTLMQGYGAYGVTISPGFSPASLVWLKRGGVLAYAHIRGGGEYGEDWHHAGMLLTKSNTWNDFIACAQYLIDRKYTSPQKLSIEGGSAGGITVGRALTERPDLFGAVIDAVGVSNPLRQELSPNGPPNVPEFGSFTTADGFKALYAMDAYHHVKDGVKYPAILLTTGINDPRVPSWEPAKMTARLQAATASEKPVLLRVDYDAGHGIGSTRAQSDEQLADEDAFLFWQLGVTGF